MYIHPLTKIIKRVGVMDTTLRKKNNTGIGRLLDGIKRDKYLLLLLAPGLILTIIYKYIPMGGILIAFKNYNIFSGIWASPWVGFRNFVDIFNSPDFMEVFRNTVIISLYKMAVGFPVPIILALMLNELRNKYFKNTIQTILYLPYFISWVVVYGMMLSLFSTSGGMVVEIFNLFGAEPFNILTKPQYFRTILVLSDVWKNAGWGTIIYLAALSNVDQELYEAAFIDGANRWKQLWNITLPSITSVIVVLLILNVGFLLDAGFDQIIVMQNDLVKRVSDIFDTYVYRTGLTRGQYSMSTAIGLFKSVVALILILGTNKIAKIVGEEGLL